MVPVVPYNFPPNGSSRLGPGTTTEFASLHPYHPIDDLYVQEDGDLELLRQDPFFMLGRLFLRVAQSWSPLLNFVEEDIDACTVGDQEYLQSVLDQLRFNANLVMRIKGFLAENLHVIQERGDASWPRVSEPALEHKILAVQSSLIKNYKFLIVRCEQLAARCERGSGILVSAAQLIEAHEGTNQARQVHDLTRLAFVFIPLTFVASIFGMNVSVFRGYPSIWIYFLVAAPLTMLSWIVSGKLALTGRTWNCLHRCIRRRNRKQSNDQDETQEDP